MSPGELREYLGPIDVYLFDQLVKGRLAPGMRVLDAGCGGGRNLVYLLRHGFDVHGVDEDAGAIREVRALAAMLAPKLTRENFTATPIEAMLFAPASFDFVICNAVLHFARGEAHFGAMLSAMSRVLKPGGIFFARLMSTHGVEHLIEPLGDRLYHLPDGGSPVFLVDEPMLSSLTRIIFDGELLDPIKSTIVHSHRTMTTWVLVKGYLP